MDAQFLKKLQKGDEAAFEQLVEQYQHKVYAVALHMMGNEQDAYDAAQEAFLKVYKSVSRFKGESSLFTWMYRITTNVCLDLLRKRRDTLRLTPEEDGPQLQPEATYGNPEEELERKDRVRLVRQAIQALPEDMKTVIVLRDIRGLGYDEIAAILNLSLGTVKSRISRGREQLKKILQKNGELFEKNGV